MEKTTQGLAGHVLEEVFNELGHFAGKFYFAEFFKGNLPAGKLVLGWGCGYVQLVRMLVSMGQTVGSNAETGVEVGVEVF